MASTYSQSLPSPLEQVPEIKVPEQDQKANTCSSSQTPSPVEQVNDIHESDSDAPNDIQEALLDDTQILEPEPVVEEPDPTIEPDPVVKDPIIGSD